MMFQMTCKKTLSIKITQVYLLFTWWPLCRSHIQFGLWASWRLALCLTRLCVLHPGIGFLVRLLYVAEMQEVDISASSVPGAHTYLVAAYLQHSPGQPDWSVLDVLQCPQQHFSTFPGEHSFHTPEPKLLSRRFYFPFFPPFPTSHFNVGWCLLWYLL